LKKNDGQKSSEPQPRGEIQRKPAQSKPLIQAPKPQTKIPGKKSTAEVFVPRTYTDFQILQLYNSRTLPDPSLPPVSFTKKGTEGVYFLGIRKCVVEEVDCEYLVKTGSSYQSFVSWIEATERVEALRSRAMSSAVVLQQIGVVVF